MNKRFRTLLILILALFGLSLAYQAVTTTQASYMEVAGPQAQYDMVPQQNLPELSPLITKGGPGVQLIGSDDHGLILELHTPEFLTEQLQSGSEQCQVLRISGYGETETPGSPRLPVIGTMVGVPQQSTPILTILDSDLILLPDQYNLCPVERLVFNINMDGEIHTEGYQMDKDPQAYADDRFSPETFVELASTGFIRSQRVAQLRFKPFQYNPVTGELRYYNRIRLRLNYSQDQTPYEPLGLPVDEGAFETLLENTLINYDQAKAWRLPAKASALQSELDAFDPPEPAYKLLVEQDGLYQVSFTDLQSAGIPVNSLDPQTFQIFNQGAENSIIIVGEENASFDPDDYILFYGQGINTKYTNGNIYWLTWGYTTGLRMETTNGTPSGTASSPLFYNTTQHMEVDRIYRSSGPSGIDEDRWYWDYIYGPEVKNFETTLTQLATTPPSATIRGLIDSYLATPQHHTLIYLNGHLIDDATWASETEYYFEVTVPRILPG